MERPTSALLPDGKRLHLHHGPIDLIIGADGKPREIKKAYLAAAERFETVLDELVSELMILRVPVEDWGSRVEGEIAKTMEYATRPYAVEDITPMAAVAGAVAEHILASMVERAELDRAYVNNGGDIALYLTHGESFAAASPSGDITISYDENVRGLATSGWRGRSHSLGIADSVTVLAATASQADAAATMVANAVNLPLSSKIQRVPANELQPDSDLGSRLVTVGVEELTNEETLEALSNGIERAQIYMARGLFEAAMLSLNGERVSLTSMKQLSEEEQDA